MVQYKWSLPATCPILALIGLGARRQQPERRQARQLRARVRRHPRLLRAFVWRPRRCHGRTPQSRLGALDPQHRHGRRRRRCCSPGGCDRQTGRSGSACRRSGDGRPPRRPHSFPTPSARRPRIVVLVRVPHLNFPMPRMLDWYIGREYLRVFLVGVCAFIGIFYISTVIDLADKMFRGEATTGMLLRYLVLHDAAIPLLRDSDGRPRCHAGHPRRDDEEQRAAGRAGVRHQPVPHGAAAAAVRGSSREGSCTCCRSRCSRTRTVKPTA